MAKADGEPGRRDTESAAPLESTASFLDSIVENIPHMIFVKDAAELRFVLFNKAGEDLLGLRRDALIGKNDADLFPREQATFFVAKDREVLSGKGLVDITEEPIQTRHGLRVLHTKKIPIVDARGEPRFLLGISEDITERIRLEERIRRADERQRVLAQTSAALAPIGGDPLSAAARLALPVGGDGCIFLVDAASGAPRAVVAHVDHTREERWRRLVESSNLVERFSGSARAMLEAGQPLVLNEIDHATLASFTTNKKDAEELASLGTHALLLVSLRGRDQRLGTLVFLRDVTQRGFDEDDRAFAERFAQRLAGDLDNARLYRELERAEASQRFLGDAAERLAGSLDFEELVRLVPHLALPFLADWCVIYLFEDGQMRRFSVAHVDPSREPFIVATAERYPPGGKQPGAEPARTLKPVLNPVVDDALLDRVCVDADHKALARRIGTASAMAVPVRARGRVLGSISLGRGSDRPRYQSHDLTVAIALADRVGIALDNARLYQEAQAALRARDEFLSIASHELRTPLTTVCLSVDLLARGLQTGWSLDACIARVEGTQKQLARLKRLVDGLLDVSRIAAGKLILELGEVDLCALCGEIVERIAEEARRVGSELCFRGSCARTIRADAMRLEQVLTNLLTNALRYAAPAKVHVQVEVGDEGARLSVRDEGMGISSADLGRIFDRFERGGTSGAHGGLGLGLYIARQICEAHGGTIRAFSEPGRGAEFVITLPVEPPPC
ncbi:ATP-binding protein [Polyangium jinanense]|uniref:histidine kinase n=1 Tax=Polyangium jinanense TaxID=2829994 RepID=A0A9X3X9N5_9BACT|nr:ATP-binding protein [Polyangium jinanense]MDC3955966.1 GAF domain-containing protein [Polyangium jinanense]MDC3985095.1 GAF domain-containing protein [Polyangium jinanense]